MLHRPATGRRSRHVFGAVALRPPIAQHSHAEAALLMRYAAGAETIVELGVAEGGSAAELRAVMSPAGHLFLVDPYEPGRLGVSLVRMVARRAVNAVRRGHVTWMRSRSDAAVGGWVDRSTFSSSTPTTATSVPQTTGVCGRRSSAAGRSRGSPRLGGLPGRMDRCAIRPRPAARRDPVGAAPVGAGGSGRLAEHPTARTRARRKRVVALVTPRSAARPSLAYGAQALRAGCRRRAARGNGGDERSPALLERRDGASRSPRLFLVPRSAPSEDVAARASAVCCCLG